MLRRHRSRFLKRLDLAHAEAKAPNVEPAARKSLENRRRQERKLLGPHGRRDVHRKNAVADLPWAGALGDAWTHCPRPTIAIDASRSSECSASAEERADVSGLLVSLRAALHRALPLWGANT
jgi:hypothetical protein